MSATDLLRFEHDQIRRLEKITLRCSEELLKGIDVPFSDIDKITVIISEFIDAIHYGREEDAYFPCVASYDTLKDKIHMLVVEHEFGRKSARQIADYMKRWRNGEDTRESVARFLKVYSVYLFDHLNKENKFFDEVEERVLSKEEEMEMYEQYKSVSTTVKKVDDMIKELDWLETRSWYLAN
ncbi:hemerythrin domain-containing protein [Nitrosopumilus sp.]|uniref:hemerythrin domain-containing protein n=1 Tax=Nitrosopumilus sp. TaxID=2024843 RepID=UPI003D0D2B40